MKFINALGDQIKRYHDGTVNYEWYQEENKRIKDLGMEYQLIPCGKCIGCKNDKKKEWAIRCVLEAREHEHNYFITLTYDDQNKPWDDKFINKLTGEIYEDDGTWNGYLEPKDMTDFIKRLRSRWERKYDHEGIRYFYCGEYGGLGRPHYHAIFFNLPINPKTLEVLKYDKESGKALYTSKEIEKLWGKGFVVIEEFDYASAAYVAGYVQKKMGSCRDYVSYAKKGQTPEFIRMSRDGGIGKAYYEKHTGIHDNDEIVMKTALNRVENVKIPRYFDKLRESFDKDYIQEVKSRRKEKAVSRNKNLKEHTDLVMSEYLAQEERGLKSKVKELTKRDKVD